MKQPPLTLTVFIGIHFDQHYILLVLCFRFLATGETYTCLASHFRVGVTTVSRIVPEVCTAIWETMKEKYMSIPQSAAEWEEIAKGFEQRWGYPHCIGAIDGKLVIMRAPAKSGSLYFNYKGTFSVVLMALVDAYCKFIWVDVGAYGRQSDGGIFSNSNLGNALQAPNSLHLPEDCSISWCGGVRTSAILCCWR